MSVVLGLGSNQRNPVEQLSQAYQLIDRSFDVVSHSSLYTSEAYDKTEQPTYYNACLEIKTPELSPEALLSTLLSFENRMGRIRKERWGPRIIDLDIIFFNDIVLDQVQLKIPHPEWFKRSFVVQPLMELPYFNKRRKWLEGQLLDKYDPLSHKEDTPWIFS